MCIHIIGLSRPVVHGLMFSRSAPFNRIKYYYYLRNERHCMGYIRTIGAYDCCSLCLYTSGYIGLEFVNAK